MIILDTCVLRSCGLEGSSADLLRALRHTKADAVAVPWMVLEELAAQKTIPYEEKHQKALDACKALQEATPPGIAVGSPSPLRSEPVREYWRTVYREIVDVIPTSDEALREAAFREANMQAPCGMKKRQKTGFRDAAIWLSAVEYARDHPEETVYFVSGNTSDFGDGETYPLPMWRDIAPFGERFVHLTKLDEVFTRFTEPAKVDEEAVRAAVGSRNSLEEATKQAQARTAASRFHGYMASAKNGEPIVLTSGARGLEVQLLTVEATEAYRIGEDEWCTATARWLVLTGSLFFPVAFVWETRVLVSLAGDDPRLSMLRTINVTPTAGEDHAAVPTGHWERGANLTQLETLMLAHYGHCTVCASGRGPVPPGIDGRGGVDGEGVPVSPS